MKCWSSTSLHAMQNTNDNYYKGECIGHIRETTPMMLSMWDTESALPDTEMQLQHAKDIYQQQICEDKWLVCQTTENGTLLVLDRESKALFDLFIHPQTLSSLLSRYPWLSPRTVKGMVHFFLETGIVSSQETSAPSHNLDENENLAAWLHITNSCNLACTYCYLAKTAEHMSEDASLRSVDAIFRSARQHHFRQVTIKYAGGEASTRLQQVLATHKYAQMLARDHRIQFKGILLSNGILFTESMIQQLKESQIDLMISLDGLGRYHDSQRPFRSGRPSFSAVNRTINRLLASNLVPGISVTVSHENLSGLPELISYLLKRNLPFSLNYYRENQHALKPDDLQFAQQEMIDGIRAALQVIEAELPERPLFTSLLDKTSMIAPHQYSCGAGRNYLVIDQRGNIAGCHAAIEQTVTTIDAPDPLEHIRNSKTGFRALPVSAKKGCQSCQWRHWCAGGCPTLTHRVTGRWDVKSPNCDIYQALFPDILRLEALRILKYIHPYKFDF